MFAKISYFSRNGHFKSVLVNAADIRAVVESDTPVQGQTAVRVKLNDGTEYHAPGTVDAFATALNSKKGVVDLTVGAQAVESLTAEPTN